MVRACRDLLSLCQAESLISADVAVVTKIDLSAAVEFSWETAYSSIQAVRPGMPVLRVSAKTGEGMDEYLEFLVARLIELRQGAAV
jgi:Ni2+-binding GTPase involved in maturation of urease and hydrogenase